MIKKTRNNKGISQAIIGNKKIDISNEVCSTELELPDEFKTGTLLDSYMQLLALIGQMGVSILDINNEYEEYVKNMKKYEKKFRPGEEGGITDGLFTGFSFSLCYLFFHSKKQLG